MNNEYNSNEVYMTNTVNNSHNLSSQQHLNHDKNRNQMKSSSNGNKRPTRDQYKVYDQIESRERHYDSNMDTKESDTNDYSEKSNVVKREHMQIEIIPQDDNWGANTTAVTGDFSDFNDDMTEDGRSFHGKFGNKKEPSHSNIDIDSQRSLYAQKSGFCRVLSFYTRNYFGSICSVIVSICAFISPIIFIILPRLNYDQAWTVTDCGLECEGLLIGIAFKLFILFIGWWIIFARKTTAFLPRIFELRAMLVLFLCIMTFSFWLFYVVRILFTRIEDYYKILQFAASYVDVLLFIFILSVFVVRMRPMQTEFVVKVVRSPDGQKSELTIGNMSIQRAAIWVLEQYYKDFSVYNPWMENIYRKRGVGLLQLDQSVNVKKGKNGKMSRQVSRINQNDGKENGGNDDVNIDAVSMKSKKSTRMSIVGGNFNANDRFYEEYEYERRLRKRRARLLTTTEDAFTHIKRIHGDLGSISNFEDNNMPSTVMDPFEAAQAIFTSIARDLRRYLRITRQQPFFTRDSIVAHLANCISYDMSPKSFLQRYLNSESLIFNEKALGSERRQSQSSQGLNSHGVNYHLKVKTSDQSWILICDTPLYQNLEDNIMFVLKQNEVCLMCSFKRMPRFNLVEDILDPKRNKFVLKLNSETTV